MTKQTARNMITSFQVVLLLLVVWYAHMFREGTIDGFAYFWLLLPLTAILYAVAIASSVRKEDVTFGIVSSILFSMTVKFAANLRVTDNIMYIGNNYFFDTAVQTVVSSGKFDLSVIGGFFPGFFGNPEIVMLLSIVIIVSGLRFVEIFSISAPILFSVITIPFVYSLLKRGFLLDKKMAILGILWYNSIFLSHLGWYLSYTFIGYALFLSALALTGRNLKSAFSGLVILIVANALMYFVSSVMLTFFIAIFYLISRKKLEMRPVYVRVTFTLLMLSLVVVATWQTFVGITNIESTYHILETLFKHISLFTRAVPKQVIGVSEPYPYVKDVAYIGQAIIALLGFVGVIVSRKRKVYSLLWFGGITGIVFPLFGIDWSILGAADYRGRFVMYMILLMAPATSIGFHYLNKKFGSRIIISSAILSLIAFSSIAALPTYIYLRRFPIDPTEPIASPHEWYNLATYLKSYTKDEIRVLGSYPTIFISSRIGLNNTERVWANPAPRLKRTHGWFVAISRYNLEYPEIYWIGSAGPPTLSSEDYLLLNMKLNKLYDSGSVWLYYNP